MPIAGCEQGHENKLEPSSRTVCTLSSELNAAPAYNQHVGTSTWQFLYSPWVYDSVMQSLTTPRRCTSIMARSSPSPLPSCEYTADVDESDSRLCHIVSHHQNLELLSSQYD